MLGWEIFVMRQDNPAPDGVLGVKTRLIMYSFDE